MAGTQLELLAFTVGDLVCEIDGRHVGEVVALFHAEARVRWLDNGWKSDLPFDSIVLVEKRKRKCEPVAYEGPPTVVESANRRLRKELCNGQ